MQKIFNLGTLAEVQVLDDSDWKGSGGEDHKGTLVRARAHTHTHTHTHTHCLDFHIHFLGGSNSKESAWNAGDLGWIPGSGSSPGEGRGYPLQYSCLKNSMDREA